MDGLVHNPDGTITVDLRELDVRVANGELHEAGVRAVILESSSGEVPKCVSHYPVTVGAPTDVVLPRSNPSDDELTFWPDRIPSDMWLYIQSMVEAPYDEEVGLRCDLAQAVVRLARMAGGRDSGRPEHGAVPGNTAPVDRTVAHRVGGGLHGRADAVDRAGAGRTG